MKKWCLFLGLYACICLLAACDPVGPPPQEPVSPEEPRESTVVCRVVSELDSDTLVLAEQDSDTGLYTLSLSDGVITLDGGAFDPAEPGAYQALPGGSLAGTTVTVTFDGGIMESWPARFSGVTALDFSTQDFDNLGALYLRVLEDLWNVDSALNENITELGVDLTATRLTDSEREAVAYAFGTAHGLMAMETTYETLAEDGYLTPVSISAPAGEEGESPALYQWEDGCLFSITERDEPVIFSMPSQAPGRETTAYEGIRFDAGKWRAPLAAYTFYNCTAARAAGGAWGDYTAEAEMIS